MRIVITGGGTGGHVYPALALANALREQVPAPEILFVGTKAGLEAELIPKAGYRLQTIVVSGIERRLSLATLRSFWDMGVGGVQAAAILRRFRPQVVIGTGGYVCGPVVLLAHLARIPTMILEQNVIPGVTNRLLGKVVDRVAVTYAESARYFPARAGVTVTGNPIRRELLGVNRETARRKLGVPAAVRLILAVGGSVGAQRLNEAMPDLMAAYAGNPALQILHVTGKDKYADMLSALEKRGINYQAAGNIRIEPYLYEIADAYAAADLVVCRAGGITLSEITAVGLPAVIVPYPHATDNHQYYNARHLEQEGAAVLIADQELTGARLTAAVRDLLGGGKLPAMAARSKALGRPDAVDRIREMVMALAAGRR